MSKKNNGKIIINIIILSLILVIGLGTFMSLTVKDSAHNTSIPGMPENMPKGGMPSGAFPGNMGKSARAEATAVEVYKVQKGTVQRYIRTNGDVLPGSEVEIFSDVAGIIKSYNIKEGQEVTSGTRLALVDPSKPGLSYSTNPVLSTLSGTVSKAALSDGDNVTTSTVIAVISDFKNLQIQSSVPERYVSYIKKGLKAQLNFEAFKDKKFTATIVHVSPQLNSQTRSLDFKLVVDDPDGLIKAGMFAEIRLVIEESVNTLIVPTEAIVNGTGGNVLYVVDSDNKASEQVVNLGLKGASSVEVLSGIKESDLVVVKGQSFLSDGDTVRIVAGVNEE